MLNIKGLCAGYSGVDVLHHVDLELGEGESAAVVGANGAGKTTLVRSICGLVKPSAGSIAVDGQEITHLAGHQRVDHGVAVVLEGRNLFPELTVADNLRLAESAGLRTGRKIFTRDEILELFPAVAERLASPVGLMSGGQQQMVAIARALLLQPRLLLLDELSTGLAPKIVREILAALTHLRQRGTSVLLIEQSIAIASEMTDRGYVMSVGHVAHRIGKGGWADTMRDGTLVQAYLHG